MHQVHLIKNVVYEIKNIYFPSFVYLYNVNMKKKNIIRKTFCTYVHYIINVYLLFFVFRSVFESILHDNFKICKISVRYRG